MVLVLLSIQAFSTFSWRASSCHISMCFSFMHEIVVSLPLISNGVFFFSFCRFWIRSCKLAFCKRKLEACDVQNLSPLYLLIDFNYFPLLSRIRNGKSSSMFGVSTCSDRAVRFCRNWMYYIITGAACNLYSCRPCVTGIWR